MFKLSSHQILAIYLVFIGIFAMRYWYIWYHNTSSFVISEEYNLTTIPPTYFIDDLPETFDNYKANSVSEINTELALVYKKYDIKKRRKSKVQDSIKYYARSLEIIGRKLEQSRIINLNRELEKQTTEIRITKSRLQNQLDSMGRKSDIDQSDKYGIERANIKVKIAHLNVEEAKIKEKLYNQAFDTYFEKDLYEQGQQLTAYNTRLRNEDYTVEQNIRKIKSEISDMTQKYHANRRKLIDGWDFLYFSLGVATASNFGDIMPNTTAIRFLVILQIILSLILLGALINTAIESIKK